ncbi:MAG: hypothetical protein NTV51_15330 [Verrucomicrobia bacterium]|nr:hypothetical protein [Verrucomicrobiota bacterium]
MTTLESIVEELRTLPPPKLEEAASYIRSLREATRDERLAALDRTAGVWSGPEGEVIEQSIKDGCERVRRRS